MPFPDACIMHISIKQSIKYILKYDLQVVYKILCFFPKNSQKFATSPSSPLGCYWLQNKFSARVGVTVHSHCVESFEGLLNTLYLSKLCKHINNTTREVGMLSILSELKKFNKPLRGGGQTKIQPRVGLVGFLLYVLFFT